MATSVFQPPPTWALPVTVDEVSGKAVFNPVWLRWFLDLSQNLGSGGAGSVSSVAALTLGTSGTNLSSTVANPTTNAVITLNVPTASATNRGALSAADWTTFNNKGGGTVTSVAGTGTVNGITLTGTVTTAGNLALGGTLSGVSLTTQVSGILPIANGGTGTTSTTFASLTTNVSGILPIANGGTGTSTAGVSATIVTAKLTALGANGSMTFTNGLLTAQTAAT